MILANKNGWSSATEVVRTTRSGTHVKDLEGKEIFVSKADENQKLFDTVADAVKFIKG